MNIAILGFGVVGSGVYKILSTNKDIHVKKVFDKPIKKDELKELYEGNFDNILNDSSIDTIVETMGGNEFAYKLIKASLINSKNVVTSNKEVVSLHLDEFLKLAKQNNVKFLFEASVGGGIPIVNTLINNQKSNDITHIYGILNGTTNFILTNMSLGMEFKDALKLAQQKGFAEADPTADLEGLDMVRKISILSDLAYNTFIDVNDVTHIGMTSITKEIIDKVDKLGYKVKFICESIKENDSISLNVNPVLVKKDNIVSNINFENNIVCFESNTNGPLYFVGYGAGSLPTASAIVSDLYFIKDDTFKIDLELNKKYKVVENKNNKYIEGIKVL